MASQVKATRPPPARRADDFHGPVAVDVPERRAGRSDDRVARIVDGRDLFTCAAIEHSQDSVVQGIVTAAGVSTSVVVVVGDEDDLHVGRARVWEVRHHRHAEHLKMIREGIPGGGTGPLALQGRLTGRRRSRGRSRESPPRLCDHGLMPRQSKPLMKMVSPLPPNAVPACNSRNRKTIRMCVLRLFAAATVAEVVQLRYRWCSPGSQLLMCEDGCHVFPEIWSTRPASLVTRHLPPVRGRHAVVEHGFSRHHQGELTGNA